MTWREMLAAGAFDARIRAYRELLEKALEQEGDNRAEAEKLMNLALARNLEVLGPAAAHTALANLAAEIERDGADPELIDPISSFFGALPIYVDFDDGPSEEEY